jgi:hypothetical protein
MKHRSTHRPLQAPGVPRGCPQSVSDTDSAVIVRFERPGSRVSLETCSNRREICSHNTFNKVTTSKDAAIVGWILFSYIDGWCGALGTRAREQGLPSAT